MKHFASRSLSVQTGTTYRTPGLGDRVHAATIAYVYAYPDPVTIHLTAGKIEGGRFKNKLQSWKEIAALFPSMNVQVHDIDGVSENEWYGYLQSKGYDAPRYWYADYPGPKESKEALDISPLLKRIPLLKAAPAKLDLPKRYVTMQWDSTSAARNLSPEQREKVIGRYRKQGLEVVTIGGESKEPKLHWSMPHVAWALSNAEAHVGVDSGFFHLSQLYLPIERVHLYWRELKSHHGLRARDNGAPINLHL